MKYFTKKNWGTALKAFGIMMAMDFICLLIGSIALNAEGVFSWILFAAFLAIFYIAAFMDGLGRGDTESKMADRLANQMAKTGRSPDAEEIASQYNIKKGAVIALMVAAPGLVMALLSLVTMDQNLILRLITRLYHSPYIKLFADGIPSLAMIAMYFLFSVLYPAVYLIGYSHGPKSYAKIKETIRKNDEDYKKGIRRKRPKVKKRRGLFW